MSALLMFSMKSAFVLCMLYLPYQLLLHRDSFFRLNRLVLLATLLLSLVLPLCNVTWLSLDEQPVVQAAQMQMIEIGIPVHVLDEPTVMAGEEEEKAPAFPVFTLCAFIYIIGMAVVLVLRLSQIARLRLGMRHGCLWHQKEEGTTVYCHAGNTPPFSWMRCIVINEKDYAEAGREIILHEKGHIRALHSWDMLALTAVQMVQWWNPLVYLLGTSLRDIHEFQADDYVLRQGISAKAYQLLLIKKAVGYGSYTFANNFNHSLTKKRIAMMRKSKSNPWMRSKVLYVIPVTTLALSVFATPEIVSPVQDVVSKFESKGTDTSADLQAIGKFSPEIMGEVQNATTANEDTIYGKVDKNAEYPGGTEALMKFIMTNLKYPETCRKEGIQGRVVIKFVVNTDGSIVDMEEARSPHADLTAEAMRIIKMMPKWTPATVGGKTVRSRFLLPVMFRLDGGKKINNNEKASQSINVSANTNGEATQKATAAIADENKVYDKVDKNAEYPGGLNALMKFLMTNLKYPETCRKEGIQGRVVIKFVVNTDGSIVDMEEARSPHADLTAEAMRIIKMMPKWTPATVGGKTVRSRFNLPVFFRFPDTKAKDTEEETSNNNIPTTSVTGYK